MAKRAKQAALKKSHRDFLRDFFLSGTISVVVVYAVARSRHFRISEHIAQLNSLLSGLVSAFAGIALKAAASDYVKSHVKQFRLSHTTAAGRIRIVWAWSLIFTIGGLLCGFVLKWARSLRDLFWPQLDLSVVRPIPAPMAYDPIWGTGVLKHKDDKPLPWITPGRSHRLYPQWTELKVFAKRYAGEGRNWPLVPPESGEGEAQFEPFRWILITGPTGSGKTRLIVEFLRQELGHVPLFENRKKKWQQRRLAVGAWLRRTLPWVARSANDPWDVGWLQPNSTPERGQDIHEARYPLHESFLNKDLEKWRPRRPTALILDDPRNQDADRVRRVLERNSTEYHYPARLFIVSQSVPSELGMTCESGKWKSDSETFHGCIITLDEKTFFTSGPLLGLLSEMGIHSGLLRPGNPERSQTIDKILEITEGNPILLEIAIHELVKGRDIRDLDADGLILARARRVMEALELVYGKDQSTFQQLASMTLVGPTAYLDDSPPAVTSRRSLGWNTKIVQSIESCHNLSSKLRIDNEGYERRVSCVRPQRVGDSFVRLVLETKCQGSESNLLQREVVQLAWHLHPDGVLDAVARASGQVDVLGRLLRESPPEALAVASEKLFINYTKAATLMLRGEPWPSDNGAAILECSCGLINQLSPVEAMNALSEIFRLLDGEPQISESRPASVWWIYSKTLERCIESGIFPQTLSDFRTVNDALQDIQEDCLTRPMGYYFPDNDPVIGRMLSILESIGEPEGACDEVLLEKLRLLRHMAFDAAEIPGRTCQGATDECELLLKEVDPLLETWVHAPTSLQTSILLERLRIWRSLAAVVYDEFDGNEWNVGFRPDLADMDPFEKREFLLARVEGFMALPSFARMPEFVLEQVRFLRHAEAQVFRPDGLMTMGDGYERISTAINALSAYQPIQEPFGAKLALEQIRALALESVPLSDWRSIVHQIDEHAGPYLHRPEFALERTNFAMRVSYQQAAFGNIDECSLAVKVMDKAAEDFLDRPYIALLVIQGWQNLIEDLGKHFRVDECRLALEALELRCKRCKSDLYIRLLEIKALHSFELLLEAVGLQGEARRVAERTDAKAILAIEDPRGYYGAPEDSLWTDVYDRVRPRLKN